MTYLYLFSNQYLKVYFIFQIHFYLFHIWLSLTVLTMTSISYNANVHIDVMVDITKTIRN